MPNTFNHDMTDLATTAAKIAGLDLVLASYISSDVADDFRAGAGATIRVPVPSSVATHTRGIYDTSTPLTAGSITEQAVDVTLTEEIYSLVPLSTGDYSLEFADLAKSVIRPQAGAIAKQVEARTATALSATPVAADITYAPASPAAAFTAARRQLRDNGVPSTARLIAAVGSGVYADLLDAPAGKGFDADGKVKGFEVIESTRIASGDIVAFIPEAFTLVVRAPANPEGAAYAASVATPIDDKDPRSMSFAVRSVIAFDASLAVDRSLVSALVKVQAMPLAVDRENGTVELVEHGGAVRITTA